MQHPDIRIIKQRPLQFLSISFKKKEVVFDAPLTFPLSNKCLPPRLRVQAEVFHHAVDAVVQSQAAGLGEDGLSADGALVFLFPPLLDAITAEAVSTVQDDCLHGHRINTLVFGSPV